jgi:Flp pilus assembly protein TadG
MTSPKRFRGDRGQVGGIEVIPFGILTFVIGMLVIVNVWGVVDSELATSSAAREAVRAFVESPDEVSAVQRAQAATQAAFAGQGRSSSNSTVSIAYIGDRGWSRCSRVTITVRHPVHAVRLPIIGGFGHGFDAVASQSEVIDPFRSGLHGDAQC